MSRMVINRKKNFYEFMAKPRFAWIGIPLFYLVVFIIFLSFLLIAYPKLNGKTIAIWTIVLMMLIANLIHSTKTTKKIIMDDKAITLYNLRGEYTIPFSSITKLERTRTTWRNGIVRYVIWHKKDNRTRWEYFTLRHIENAHLLLNILRSRLGNIPQTNRLGLIVKRGEEDWPLHKNP